MVVICCIDSVHHHPVDVELDAALQSTEAMDIRSECPGRSSWMVRRYVIVYTLSVHVCSILYTLYPSDWSIILIIAVAFSGSSFGAIELANSNLFGYELFCMGLSARHLKEFQGKRFFSSVLFENAPQLGSQIYFLVLLGSPDEATVVALLSSTVSIVLSVVDVWSARHLVSVMKRQAKTGMDVISIEFNIDTTNQAHDEIEHLKSSFLTKPNHLRKAIAQTLIVHPRNIEIYQLIAANPGVKAGFTVYSVDRNQDTESMMELMSSELKLLSLSVAKYWKMKTYPNITNIREGHGTGPGVIPLTTRTNHDGFDDDDDEQTLIEREHHVREGEAYLTDFTCPGGVGGRGRTLSKSSTYSQAASKKLMRISRLNPNTISLLKASDPEVQSDGDDGDDGDEEMDDPSEEMKDDFNSNMTWSDFMRLRNHKKQHDEVLYKAINEESSTFDGSWTHKATKPKNAMFKVGSFSNEEEEEVSRSNDRKKRVHFKVDTFSTICENHGDDDYRYPDGDEHWDQYTVNMERLIHSHSKREEGVDGDKEQWLLIMENMKMLLNTRRQIECAMNNMETRNKGRSITAYSQNVAGLEILESEDEAEEEENHDDDQEEEEENKVLLAMMDEIEALVDDNGNIDTTLKSRKSESHIDSEAKRASIRL